MISFRTAVGAVAATVVVVACAENVVRPTALRLEDMKPALQTFNCVATVVNPGVTCSPANPELGDTRASLQTIGGQGIFVRIATSNVTYNSGTSIFSFNTTVQNFTDVKFATADGSTPDNGGVRLFFHAGPTVTGGTGSASVANATGTVNITGVNQPYFQYGGNSSDSAALGADKILSPTETSSGKNWQLNVPSTVTSFTFQLLVSTQTSSGSFVSQAPQITSQSVDTLIVGSTVTINGSNFSSTPGDLTVKLGNEVVPVTTSSPTSLQFTVPCIGSGIVPLTVTKSNMTSNARNTPTRLPTAQLRSLGVGQAVVVTDATESQCNELEATGVTTSYIVALVNIGTSPTTSNGIHLTGDPLGGEGPAIGGDFGLQGLTGPRPAITQESIAEANHFAFLKRNLEEAARLRSRFAGDKRMRYNIMPSATVNTPPLNMTIRVPNIGVGGFCQSFYAAPATRVYYNGKIAIYEDDSTAAAFKGANNATMAANYQKIGDQFNADMEPVLNNNFGDVLLRDASTDNNGVLIALFTPKINQHFAGVAGFVVSCDQYPRDSSASNGSSNFGEYFYAYMPDVDGTGYSSGNTPDNWYRTIRSTFIHEAKHSVAMATRVVNSAPFEAAWLEEGSARMAEEMWGREKVYNIAWKSNYGYGSFADPKNIYCDVRPAAFSECDGNTRAPVNNMNRHFSSLYTTMFGANARLLSPFGLTPSDNASYYYANSWSLIRYAIDQYGISDAAFLKALTSATTTGTTNLTDRAGVSLAQLMGGWALQFAADDYPGLASPAGVSQNKTWNLRNIYSGYNSDFSGSFTLAYPLTPTAFSFGSFNATAVTTMYGGGILWYQVSGTQTARQLLRLRSNSDGTVSSNLRVAIMRVQ